MNFWSGFIKEAEDEKKKSILHPGYALAGAGLGGAYGWNHGLPIEDAVAPKNIKGILSNPWMSLDEKQIKDLKKARVAGTLIPALAGSFLLHALRNVEDVGDRLK